MGNHATLVEIHGAAGAGDEEPVRAAVALDDFFAEFTAVHDGGLERLDVLLRRIVRAEDREARPIRAGKGKPVGALGSDAGPKAIGKLNGRAETVVLVGAPRFGLHRRAGECRKSYHHEAEFASEDHSATPVRG